MEIDSTQTPIYIPVRPVPKAKMNECFGSVLNHISLHGGRIQYGWIIWEELQKRFLEAEFHAVWVSPSGEFVDIMPKIDKENTILFMPDSKRIYKGQLIENRRKLLVISDLILEWLWFGHNCHSIKEKHFENGKLNEIAANAELVQWMNFVKKNGVPIFSRSGSCPCGSGKKLKLCHGR
ncbi:MAG: SEC-C domain-containing protein [Dehalococcoidia bacterium]|nr:SEC-C domain-containing protein [Dehalococcoidia bacterium]MDD5494579.1 SEC-C domain-containing protein [Dehalococcoidia bacterium]